MTDCIGQAVKLTDIPVLPLESLEGTAILFAENPDTPSPHETYKTAGSITLETLTAYLEANTAIGGGVAIKLNGTEIATAATALNFIGDFTVSEGAEEGIVNIVNPEITFSASISISPYIVDVGNIPASVTVSWNYSGADPVSQSLNGVDIADINQRTDTITTPNDNTFTIAATSDYGNSTATKTIIQRTRNYYARGNATMASLGDVVIEGSLLDADRVFTAPFGSNTSGTAGYLYIIYEASKGAATLRAENNDDITGDFQPPLTLSLDNGYGDVRDYFVYRSKNTTQGAFTVEVT